nr:MAG TPA: hypothetical protein [Caudoviricetes sp.]
MTLVNDFYYFNQKSNYFCKKEGVQPQPYPLRINNS